jgi:glycerate kinase
MRLLVAPCSFKGTMSAVEAAAAIADGARAAGADVDVAPIADGGEGTLDAMIAAVGGTVMGVIARGPLGLPVRAHIGLLADNTAVIELAQASGLGLVPETARDPMRATTYGTGELIKGALARRPDRLLVGLGGSATVDGGVGIARALGMRFLDHDGADVAEGGAGLADIARIDTTRLDPRLVGLHILVAADVTSTLAHAARVFGPQKGATREMIDELERGLANLGRVIERDLHVPVFDHPGAGAAGGAGAMLLGLGGDVRSGAEIVMQAMGFADRLARADLVVTGEGRLDASTMAGKGPAVVARTAAAAGVPCVALVGDVAIEDAGDLFAEVRTATTPGELRGIGARLVSDRLVS